MTSPQEKIMRLGIRSLILTAGVRALSEERQDVIALRRDLDSQVQEHERRGTGIRRGFSETFDERNGRGVRNVLLGDGAILNLKNKIEEANLRLRLLDEAMQVESQRAAAASALVNNLREHARSTKGDLA